MYIIFKILYGAEDNAPAYLCQPNSYIMTHTYSIEGMTCGSCATTIKDLLEKVPGIRSAKVTLVPPMAEVQMDRHVDISELKNALRDHARFKISEHSDIPATDAEAPAEEAGFWTTYKPIILIFSYLLGLTVLIEVVAQGWSGMRWMSNFMAGFFLVFSFFKLLDIRAFAYSYSTYDVIAKKWIGWGFLYPFVELALGILYLSRFEMVFTNAITFVVMGISTIGVLQAVLKKKRIRCACLGAVFNLPMSTITLIEDLLMVAMSGFMLILHLG